MRLTTAAATGLGLMMATMMPGQAAAEAKIYAYGSKANYCPDGLQPVTIAGVICCGAPNQSISYQQALAHPVSKKRRHVQKRPVYSAKAHCPAGTKGCAYD